MRKCSVSRLLHASLGGTCAGLSAADMHRATAITAATRFALSMATRRATVGDPSPLDLTAFMADDSIWFRIGYQIEKARQDRPSSRLRSLAERRPSSGLGRKDAPSGSPRPEQPGEGDERFNALLIAGGAALASRLLNWWPARGRVGPLGLFRAAAAGAGATFLARLLGPLLHGESRFPDIEDGLADALLAGAARGMVYATVVEPRVPGSALVRGVTYGSLEFLVSPWGGLLELVGKQAPHRLVPYLAAVLDGYHPEDEGYLDHLIFALALALFYGAADLREGGEMQEG